MESSEEKIPSEKSKEIFFAKKDLLFLPFFLVNKTVYHNATLVDLSDNKLANIPQKFYSNFPQLKQLYLQHNHIVTLHPDFMKLIELKELYLDFNDQAFLPPSIFNLPKLEVLSASNNKLESIPVAVKSDTSTLVYLNLNNNRIRALPDEIGNLSNLTSLHILHNCFVYIPISFSNLRKLETFSLEWLNYAIPPLQTVLEGAIAANVLTSLRGLCEQMKINNSKECSLLAFLNYFSNNNFRFCRCPEECIIDNILCKKVKFRTPLHVASHEGDIGVVQGFLLHKPDIDIIDSDGHTALSLSILESKFEVTDILLKNGANVNIGGGPFGSALHLACTMLNEELANNLLLCGANANKMDKDGNTPLHAIIKIFDKNPAKAATIATKLMAAGAKPNVKNNGDWAVIHFAAKKDTPCAISWIFQQNEIQRKNAKEIFDVNCKGGDEHWSPLHIAGNNGNFLIVKLLLKNKADLFAINKEFRTPCQVSRRVRVIGKILKREEILKYRSLFSSSTGELPTETATPHHFNIENDILQHETERPKHKARKQSFEDWTQMLSSASIKETSGGSMDFNFEHAVKTSSKRNLSEKRGSKLQEKPQVTTESYIIGLETAILNNNLEMRNRYAALSKLMQNRNKIKLINDGLREIMKRIHEITNLGLKIDIAANILHIQNYAWLDWLAGYYKLSRNSRLQFEVSCAIWNSILNIKANAKEYHVVFKKSVSPANKVAKRQVVLNQGTDYKGSSYSNRKSQFSRFKQ